MIRRECPASVRYGVAVAILLLPVIVLGLALLAGWIRHG